MAREHFFYDENRRHLQLLDEAARRSGVSRGQAWDDFLVMGVAALSGGAMEDQYMDVVEKHTEGEPGKRGCDSLAQLFGSVVNAMADDPREGTREIPGDLFIGWQRAREDRQPCVPVIGDSAGTGAPLVHVASNSANAAWARNTSAFDLRVQDVRSNLVFLWVDAITQNPASLRV